MRPRRVQNGEVSLTVIIEEQEFIGATVNPPAVGVTALKEYVT